MKILLVRYYGDEVITKSRMWVKDEKDEVLMECEAREGRFVEYEEYFKGCSKCCLPVGVFAGMLVATDVSPMTVKVVGAAGHRNCRFAYSLACQGRMGEVMIGESDGYHDPRWRMMVGQDVCFAEFDRLVRHAYIKREPLVIEVRNELVDALEFRRSKAFEG